MDFMPTVDACFQNDHFTTNADSYQGAEWDDQFQGRDSLFGFGDLMSFPLLITVV